MLFKQVADAFAASALLGQMRRLQCMLQLSHRLARVHARTLGGE